jgi:hypothetical protein
MSGYHPARHITAKELRSQGVPVPRQIPDHAFMRRDGFRLKTVKETDTALEEARKKLKPGSWQRVVQMTMECETPFQDEQNIYHVDPQGNILVEQINEQ